jgi:hypothetical protein
MAKFDLKKAILENKATFFGSLTEGQFSWMTQDTGQQIGSQDENKIPVYMFDNKGKYYYENDYDGYGEFGGKDYYDLVAEMNGYTADDAEKFGGTFGELRGIGIKLAFGELEPKNGGPVLFPALVTKPDKFNYKSHNFAVEAETDPNQSWYEPEEDEEDNSFDLDDDEEYGYNDDEEELDENKVEEAYNTYSFKVAKKFAEYMSKKEGRNFEVTPNSVDEYSFDLDLDGESYEGGSYLIKGNGDIVNVAITPNEVYGNINQLDENKEAKPTTKMKKSELKAKIKEMIVAEYEKDVDYTDETAGYDFLAELEGMLDEADETEKDTAEAEDVTVDDTETIDTETEVEVDPNVKAVQDSLTQAMEAARQLGDKKLQDQIGNTITFFTRAHVANTETGTMAEGEESLNEDLTSTITILLAFLIGIPGVPIAGALMMGLVDYIFNGLPDQYNEYRSLKSYKGSDKQEEILALAKEIESKLSPGKKRYLKTLVNRIGVAKLEDKARAYRELDRYASGRELDENLNADIESALKDLPVPTDMEEGKKSYYKDAEADDAEHIKALEKDMKDDKKSSMNEVMFPMLKRILK